MKFLLDSQAVPLSRRLDRSGLRRRILQKAGADGHALLGDVIGRLNGVALFHLGERVDRWTPGDRMEHVPSRIENSSRLEVVFSGRHALSHQIGHVLDIHRLSDCPGWRMAWTMEIASPQRPLSGYALFSSAEGFAEFWRLLLDHPDGGSLARTAFPLCWKFCRRHALLEE